MSNEPTHLDLFAGIGGFSLAAHWAGFRTIAHAEVCPDASRVLEYWWPGVPNLGDVRNIGPELAEPLGLVDLLTAGVPCQPASLLGARRGTADDRWLWPDTLRIVRELRPRFCVFENPPDLLTLEGGRAFNGIVGQLAALGYVGFYDVLPAAAVGAGHLRERVFLVVADAARWQDHNGGGSLMGGTERGREGFNQAAGAGGEASAQSSADTDSERFNRERVLLRPESEAGRGAEAVSETQGRAQAEPAPHAHGPRLEGLAGNEVGTTGRNLPPRPASAPLVLGLEREDWLETESPVVPLVHGLSNRVAEAALRCVGNSVCPQVALRFLDAIRTQLK